MGAALGLSLLYLGVLWCSDKAHHRLQTAGMVAARVLLLLFPPAARDALALLNCSFNSVSAAGCSSLTGCSGSISTATGSTVSVRVLASNPFYVCWTGGSAHITAGSVAAASLVCVVTVFPSASFWAVWRLSRRGRIATLSNQNAEGSSTVVVNPMRQEGMKPMSRESQSKLHDGVEQSGAPLLTPFLSDYRPEAWYTRHADLALTLLLAALQVTLSCMRL